jgi:hypothetical protein
MSDDKYDSVRTEFLQASSLLLNLDLDVERVEERERGLRGCRKRFVGLCENLTCTKICYCFLDGIHTVMIPLQYQRL